MKKKMSFYLDPDNRKWTMEDLGLSFEDLFDEDELAEKTIDGVYFAQNRKIIEWTELLNHCPVCLERLSYNDQFDSVYCDPCNEWRDIECDDPNCEYCLERPKKPSDCDESK